MIRLMKDVAQTIKHHILIKHHPLFDLFCAVYYFRHITGLNIWVAHFSHAPYIIRCCSLMIWFWIHWFSSSPIHISINRYKERVDCHRAKRRDYVILYNIERVVSLSERKILVQNCTCVCDFNYLLFYSLE